MKLFVTDYDDTLYTSDEQIQKNNIKLKELKDNGFCIVIATGRSITSIKTQINTYNIIYDFLACSDGSIIYDKNDHIVFAEYLNPIILDDFKLFYQNLDYEEIQFSYPDGYHNTLNDKKTLLGINVCLSNDNYSEEILTSFYHLKQKYLQYNFLAYKHPHFSYLCIKPQNVSKSYAISFLIDKLKIKKKDVFVIGDSSNDLEMLIDFHGVRMTNSNEEINKHIKKHYDELEDYVIDILKE